MESYRLQVWLKGCAHYFQISWPWVENRLLKNRFYIVVHIISLSFSLLFLKFYVFNLFSLTIILKIIGVQVCQILFELKTYFSQADIARQSSKSRITHFGVIGDPGNRMHAWRNAKLNATSCIIILLIFGIISNACSRIFRLKFSVESQANGHWVEL